MAVVACFCGAIYSLHDGGPGQCPYCARVAVTPRVTTRDAEQMQAEISALIEAHNPKPPKGGFR